MKRLKNEYNLNIRKKESCTLELWKRHAKRDPGETLKKWLGQFIYMQHMHLLLFIVCTAFYVWRTSLSRSHHQRWRCRGDDVDDEDDEVDDEVENVEEEVSEEWAE